MLKHLSPAVCAALASLALASAALAEAPTLATTPPAAPLNDSQLALLTTTLASDDSFKVRLQAAVLLGRSQSEKAVQPLIDALGNDANGTVRAAAAIGLANLRDPRAVSHLLKRIGVDPEAFVVDEARRSLGKFDRQAALVFAVSTCNSADPRVRKEAIAYVAAEPTAAIEPVLQKALGDTPEIADIVKASLAKMQQPELFRLLEGAIEHREPSVRHGAVDVLRTIKAPEATQLVLRVYERDVEEDEVRTAARAALRDLRAFLPVETFIKDATKSPEKYARARALRLLGVLGGEDAEKVLLAALADRDPYVCGNAVMALGELGNPAVAPALERMADDPANQRIVHLVRHALKQLRGKKDEDAPQPK